MKIQKVKLAGFGSFNRGLEIDFGSERLAMVIGRNEAGKSTLMSAIFGVLFGFKDAALQKKFEPWDAHDAYAGEVEIATAEGRRYLIKRDFTDNTAEMGEITENGYQGVFLGSANPRGRSDEDIEYYARLEGIVGFQDEGVFRGTVFMGQSALETAIDDQIRRLVSGSSSTDFKGALHDLHSRYSEITTENPWRKKSKARPRKLEKTAMHLEETVERLEKARETFLRTVGLEHEIVELEAKQQRAKADLEDNRSTLGYFERFLKLVRDRESARERFQEADSRRGRYLENRERVVAIDKEAKERYGQFAKSGEEFPELVARLKSETRELEVEEDGLEREKKTLRELRPVPNDKLGLALGALGALAGGFVLQQFGPVPGGVSMVALAVGLFFGGRRLATGFKERKAELEASVAARSRAVAERERAIEELIGRSGGVLGQGDPDEVLRDYRRFRQILDERQSCLSAMKALGVWEEIEGTYRRTAEENLRCNGLMEIILSDAPYLAEISEDPVSVARHMEELKRRIQDSSAEIEITQEVVTEAKVELARVAGQSSEDLPALEAEVATTRRRFDALELDRDALRVVIDTLEECVEEFQEGDLVQLSEEVSTLFRKITSNRYTRVTLSPNMDPMLTKFDNTHIHPDDLSQGTRDQLYFAMRIAIAKHLSAKVPLPFFLDDPFVNFDEERLQVTRDMLEQIEEHQVVMVTCDRNYESWNERILDLDAARAESMATGAGVQLAPSAPRSGEATHDLN
ncbi:MAG: AAA family ATPase [Planctomycetota bacterium]